MCCHNNLYGQKYDCCNEPKQLMWRGKNDANSASILALFHLVSHQTRGEALPYGLCNFLEANILNLKKASRNILKAFSMVWSRRSQNKPYSNNLLINNYLQKQLRLTNYPKWLLLGPNVITQIYEMNLFNTRKIIKL